MTYPNLIHTPIIETIFSVSFKEIIDPNCFKKYLELDEIKNKFKDIKPGIGQEFKLSSEGSFEISSYDNGFRLKSDNEVLQIRKGSFSFHYLKEYNKFDVLLENFNKYWNIFDSVTKDELTITDYSVRYINVINTDKENQATHLVQLYPKQSGDRIIRNFQNSVQFSYLDTEDYLINAVSTKLNDDKIILDISVRSSKMDTDNVKDLFLPLRNLKNRAFFDSITARTLIKYIQPK